MSHQSKSSRHRHSKRSEEKKGSRPFFGSPGKKMVQKKQDGAFFQRGKGEGMIQRLATAKEDEKFGTNDARMEKDKQDPLKPTAHG